MKCFVLCGGEGTRLRPYTYSTPKPMLNVAGKPILQYTVENLKRNSITDLILTIGYKKEQIKEYFGNGKNFGVKIEYLEEDSPKGTAGGLLEYKDKINETFAVVMGDQISNVELKKIVEHHKKQKNTATLALLKNKIPLEYGVVEVKSDGSVEKFVEKPVIQNYINMAIYVFEPKIFDYIKEKDDFSKHVFPKMLEQKEKIGAYALEDATWFDVGRITDYERLNETMKIIQLVKG